MYTPDNTEEAVRALRKEIDGIINLSKHLGSKYLVDREMKSRDGMRELALCTTKLQEAKMWAGQVLDAIGVPLPAAYADKHE